jgi:hypothetical protein
MTTIVPKIQQPRDLLNRILDTPELPAIIQRLDAGVLARLIRHVGLEDSAEIVSLATVDQLKRIFDEDLWISPTPGCQEVFDAERFGLWLEVMLETGTAFTAHKIMEMDEDMVTLALSRLVIVIDQDELARRMADADRSVEDDILDKVLESTLNQEFDAFLVVARSHAHWEAIRALLVELNELDFALLRRLLERCDRISRECIEDSGGLFNVLSTDEMLEGDIAAEREARRENQGFVSAAAAVEFLTLSRSSSQDKIMAAKTLDPASRAYFKAAEARVKVVAKHRSDVGSASTTAAARFDTKVAGFLRTLQAADVIQGAEPKRLHHTDESWDHHLPLAKALRVIHHTNTALYEQRLMELSYLSNVLMAGCTFQGRDFRPVEAAEAAFSVCNLGAEIVLAREPEPEETSWIDSLTGVLTEHRLVTLFQAGWKRLYEEVVIYTAKVVASILEQRKGQLAQGKPRREIIALAEALKSHIATGRPWVFANQLDQLLVFLDGPTVEALTALMQEYPTRLPGPPFIWSRSQIRQIYGWGDALRSGGAVSS